jgi:uncharacterized membrane protein
MRVAAVVVLALSLAACADDAPTAISRRAEPRPALAIGISAPVDLGFLLVPTRGHIAYAIDEAGRAVGISQSSEDDQLPVLYEFGSVIVLPLPLGHRGIARGVSPNGRHIVGAVWDPAAGSPSVRAVRWTDRLGPILLDSPPNTFPGAFDVNNAGQVAGRFFPRVGARQVAVRWEADASMTLVGPMPDVTDDDLESASVGINAAGVVVGFAVDEIIREWRGFTWSPATGMVRLLPPVGFPADERNYSLGQAINDFGVVAGTAAVPEAGGLVTRAVLWNPGAPPVSLGTLGLSSGAWDINNQSQVVGQVNGGPFLTGAVGPFVWEPGEAMTMLPMPAAPFSAVHAYGISDAGQIVGAGCCGNASHAFRWGTGPGFINLPPSAAIATVAPFVEGSTVTFAGSGVDPNGDPVTFEWDLDGDLDFDDATGPSPSRTFADQGLYRVGLRTSDPQGATSTAVIFLIATNAAPVIRSVLLDMPTLNRPLVGQGFSIGFTWSDRGVADAPWHWVIQWGDGATSSGDLLTQTTLSASHVYGAAGSRTLRLLLSDKDGGATSRTVAVEVQP